PSRSNLVVGAAVFPYLEQPAKTRLVDALDANPGRTMRMNSGLRTVAQQYLLSRWASQGRCGISIAAKPGHSNHETGLAIDIDNASLWKTSLQNRGFHYAGSADPVHFDYAGSGAVDHRGLDVLAFQRLWNENHPNDLIAEDGDYGPQTESRLKQAPADGFDQGATCVQADAACDESAGEMCG
ncbi:MAG TPA: M15 family metallopeptidase, partial [Polyangiaceae bacterium]|nr:M15 family metallopeptidase [Polyangiaceae bacterium]